MLRPAASVILLALAAAAAPAQIAPTPDSPVRGDTSPGGSAASGPAKPAEGAGLPSDVRATPPETTTQAPPAAPDDTAPADTKAKGRARPSSTAKTPPRA